MGWAVDDRYVDRQEGKGWWAMLGGLWWVVGRGILDVERGREVWDVGLRCGMLVGVFR